MLIALMALTAQAHAAISDGVWVSPDMQIQIAFNGYDFTRYDPETDTFIQCRITDWPISSPVAVGECDNGERHELDLSGDGIAFDGTKLTRTLEGLD
jgi:hypothetical protein